MRFFREKCKKAWKINTSRHKKSPADHPAGVIEQGYKDSNLEMDGVRVRCLTVWR